MHKGGRGSILIIDDEPYIVSSIMQYLHNRGYSVVGTTDPEVVETLMEAGIFRLLIVDIKMEGIDGISLIRRLKRKGFNIKVIFISALVDEYAEAVDEVEADCIIEKPFNLQELSKKVRELLINEGNI